MSLDRRSGRDERERGVKFGAKARKLGAVSREPAIPVRRKDLFFGRRVEVIRERHVLARETFSRGFREDYTTVPPRATLDHSLTQIFVWLRGGCRPRADSGAAAGTEPTPRSLFAALSWAENLPQQPGKNLAPAASGSFAAPGEL